eukprot:XP_025012589.1 uncharacterized protein LOC112534353 [Ricinus communis]
MYHTVQKVDRQVEDDERVKILNKWLENVSKGITCHQLEALSLHGLIIVHLHKGFILCNFVVSNRISVSVLFSDGDGNWNVGAMATLIDDEEVEIEAKVTGEKGKLMSVVIEVRRKDNEQLIALGRQWMASNNIISKAKL